MEDYYTDYLTGIEMIGEVEFLSIFVLACFFTLLFWLRKAVSTGAISTVTWFILATLYLICEPLVNSLSWLFVGIGLIMMALTFIEAARSLHGTTEEF